ncbi:MAG: tRNA lysidine(34) synthetase TilS [Asticcacaulis sp.]
MANPADPLPLTPALFPALFARVSGSGPLGVAVSGGGDSVALLQALAEWGQRPLEVFCVDHGLNPDSRAWTQSVADHACRLGAGFTALYWQGDKPVTGLSAAARHARHALLAEAARQKGIKVLCLAHTLDDIAEAQAMRLEGSNVASPKPWSPSPAWPEGRGLFLCRPFLNLRREALRVWLREKGVAWIDDPANDSPKSLRARMRQDLQGQGAPQPEISLSLSSEQVSALLYQPEKMGRLGLIVFQASVLWTLPEEVARRCLSVAAVCAGGGNRLPRSAKVAALRERLSGGKAVTLCGARLIQTDGHIIMAREAGDIGRHSEAVVPVAAGTETMWDGRFAVKSASFGRIRPSGQVRARLDAAELAQLMSLPAGVRNSLPVLEKDNPQTFCLQNPVLRQSPYKDIEITCWVLPRFYAAIGAIVCEGQSTGLVDAMIGENGQ